MNILINVVGQKMYIPSSLKEVVSGSQKFVKFRFNLSNEWDGLSIFAQFQQGGKAYNKYLDDDMCAHLPPEIKEGICNLILYGTKDSVIGTTNCITFKVTKNMLVSDITSTEISETLYNQLVSKVEEFYKKAEDLIIEKISKHGQLKPEFANDISECTDTTKLYVLPDGYIYAYIKQLVEHYTNQIPLSLDVSGSEFVGDNGEDGYVSNQQLVLSTGETTPVSGVNTTGFIPVKKGDVLHFKNFEFKPVTDTTNNNRFCTYGNDRLPIINSDGVIVGTTGTAKANNYTYLWEYTVDDSGNLKTLSIVDKYNNGLAHIRFSSTGLDAKTVITINEEIVDPTYEYIWASTGHQFVPADYEERIIPLEESAEDHENRIKTLEMYGSESTSSDDIPAYIKTEADALIEQLLSKQGNRCFTMVGISDFHYSGIGDNKDNLIRACKAISYITNRIHVDAIATLGDNLPYGGTYDDEIRKNADRWSKEINEILAITQKTGIVDFRTPGNHDRFGTSELYMPDNAIYSFISGYNRQCDYVDVPGGWGYRDFNGLNLRVIVMNTSETEGEGRFATYSGFHMSTKQYKWIIDALNLSEKSNASDWQILLLSHHRADDWQAPTTDVNTDNYILPNILHAYNTGGSYTGVSAEDGKTISCDFTGKNSARLIGQIHGHHHAYIYGKLCLCQDGTQTDVMAVSTPTSGFGTGSGHNDDNDGNYYDSVKDTADETAFCIYSIDLDNHIIHAIHYGNGIDREINYA